MNRNFKKIITLISSFVALTVLFTSCNQAPPPHYNEMETHILHDAFSAIAAKDYQLSLNKLERMQELKPDAPIIYSLIKIQEENLAIQKSRELLKKQDYVTALETLNKHIQKKGISEKLLAEKNKITGLIKVYNYVLKLPFNHADTAIEELATLPNISIFGSILASYEEWQDQQKKIAYDLAEKERIRVIREIVAEMDSNLIQSSDLYYLNIAQIGTLIKNQNNYNNWLHRLYGLTDFTTSRESIFDDPVSESENMQSTMDYSVYIIEQQNQFSAKQPSEINTALLNPATFSGSYVQVIQLFRNKKYLEGYNEYKNLLRYMRNINAHGLINVLNESLISDSKFEGLSPSLDTILNHILNW